MKERNKKKKKILYGVFFALIINMLFVNYAYAADLFTSPFTDSIAQKVGLPLFAPETSPFSTIILIFNSATLLIAGLILAYTMVYATASTAHDGELLGKKWSTMFLPVRVLTAVIFMMPMGGGGFSVIQQVVHYAGVQGSALADVLWGAYVPTALKGNSYVPPETSEKIKELLKNSVQNAVCVAKTNKKIDKIVSDGDLQYIDGVHTKFSYKYFVKAGNDGRRIVGYNWGNVSQPTNSFPSYTKNVCGTTQIVFETPNFDPQTNTTSLADLKSLAATMQQVQIDQMTDLVAEAQAIGNRIIYQHNYTKEDALADMIRVSDNYSRALKAAAKEQFEKVSTTQGVIAAQKDGWMGAGSWALKINNTVSSANSIVNNLPRSSFAQDQMSAEYINTWDNEIFASAGAAAALFEQASRLDPDSPKSRTGSNDAYSTQVLSYFVSVNKDMNNVQIDYFSSNPMVIFASFGDNFLSMGNAAAATATTASLVSAIPFFGNVLTTIAAAFGTAFSMMFWAVIIPGLYLSYYVQMIPFFMFSTAVVMWFILMAEAQFASQLWMMMFTTGSHNDLIGEEKPGLNLLFSLFMRPALYIIGLIIAMNIQTPIFGFINREYISLLANNDNGDHFLWAQLGYGFGYIMIVHTLMMKIWQLPLELPENIENWMNVRGSGSVASLKGAAQETMHGTNQMSNAALPMAQASLLGGSKIMSDFKQQSDLMRNEEMKKNINDKSNTSSADDGNKTPDSPSPTDGGKDISSFNSKE